jgi:hypothetical protein
MTRLDSILTVEYCTVVERSEALGEKEFNVGSAYGYQNQAKEGLSQPRTGPTVQGGQWAIA